jgi:hypothetical protein
MRRRGRREAKVGKINCARLTDIIYDLPKGRRGSSRKVILLLIKNARFRVYCALSFCRPTKWQVFISWRQESQAARVLLTIAASIGGAHQQTSERAAPPVSVEEKGKTTGEKRKLLLFLLMSIQN